MAGMEDAFESRSRELSRYFRGVVKVPLDNLNFEHPLFQTQHRPVSQRIVDQLRQAFEKEGLRRYEPRNWIDALIDPRRLASVLAANGLTELGSEVDIIPILQLGPLDCLQGIHRILAASDLLRQSDRWWTVRLYSSELPRDVCVGIIEDNLNEHQFSDGEIFRKIRMYRKEGDEKAEKKWLARLSSAKQKDLEQLFKSATLTDAFDNLVEMPGMWYSFQLGTLHRLLTLHCDEELLRYLTRIADVWGRVLKAADAPPKTVDRVTVEKLELLAPSVSSGDRSRVESLIRSGEVFSSIADTQTRHAIFSAFLSTSGLIPSLTSFFENLKYLEPCCYILKKLLPPKERRTIFKSLSASHLGSGEQLVEYPRGRRVRSIDDDGNGLWLSYVQLWAFCMRHFPLMTETAPRKVAGKAKPLKHYNPALWHYLGDLAVKLGFRTEQALELQRQNPYRSLAEQLLRSLRPGSLPDARHVLRISSALEEIEDSPEEREKECMPSLVGTDSLSVEKRCNRPFEDDFLLDRHFFFVPTMYEIDESEGSEINTFFVGRDIFMSFLGNEYTQAPSRDAETSGEHSSITRLSAFNAPSDLSIHGSARDELRLQELTRALDEERQLSDRFRRLGVEMRSKVSSLSDEAEKRRREFQTLEKQTGELIRRCADLENHTINLDARIQKNEELFQSGNDELSRMNVLLTKKVSERDEQIRVYSMICAGEKEQLERKLEECQSLNEQLNEELDRGKILQREGHDKTKELHEHINSLQSQLAKAERFGDDKDRALQKQQSEIGRLQAKLEREVYVNRRFREKETQLVKGYEALQSHLQDASVRENELNAATRELESTIRLLQEEKTQLTNACSKLQTDLEDCSKRDPVLSNDEKDFHESSDYTDKAKDDRISDLQQQVDALKRWAEQQQGQTTEDFVQLLSISLEEESNIIGIFIIVLRSGEFWIKIPSKDPVAKIERVLCAIASTECIRSEKWDIYCNGNVISEVKNHDAGHFASTIRKHRFLYAGPRPMMQAALAKSGGESQHYQNPQRHIIKPRKRKEITQTSELHELHEDGEHF